MAHCVEVRARGAKLDQLRGEAYRVACDNKTDWWAEASDKATKFCFDNANAQASFAAVCDREKVQYTQLKLAMFEKISGVLSDKPRPLQNTLLSHGIPLFAITTPGTYLDALLWQRLRSPQPILHSAGPDNGSVWI
jgi:hypothetical protein